VIGNAGAFFNEFTYIQANPTKNVRTQAAAHLGFSKTVKLQIATLYAPEKSNIIMKISPDSPLKKTKTI
jgi:hypothetical protein